MNRSRPAGKLPWVAAAAVLTAGATSLAPGPAAHQPADAAEQPRPASVAPTPHPFRLSVADAGIAEATLHARIRFFWDDLQVAVMEHTSDMDFELAETGRVDAIIEQYINDMLVIKAGDSVLQGKVTARGIDEADIVDEVMWWYRIEYPVDESTDRLHVRNRLLFNMFEDQQNLIHMKTRRGRERAYRFSWGSDNVAIRLN